MAIYGLGDANSSRGHLEALGRYVENIWMWCLIE